jgi:hypothetical protein
MVPIYYGYITHVNLYEGTTVTARLDVSVRVMWPASWQKPTQESVL